MINKIKKSNKEWKEILTPEQYHILREKGTESPGTCTLPIKGEGVFHCVACKNPLFVSKKKFESGTGWPSFFEPYSKDSIILKEDNGLGMKRTEVLCSKCGGHLGHVFDDGPAPTYKRYCINGLILNFKKNNKEEEIATFGAGCFWHVQEEFNKIKGIIKTEVGYMGGDEKKYSNPTYDQVCSDNSRYAEVIQIIFDSGKISYKELLDVFWKIHNPTSLNQQGNDIGSQYRSIIFYHNKKQKEISELSRKEQQKKYENKIVTEIKKAETFFKAEEYHQKYFEKNKISCKI